MRALPAALAPARRHVRRRALGVVQALRPPSQARAHLAGHADPRLHVGCGGALLEGWLNTDYDPWPGATFLDATRPFPLPDARFAHVFSEHVIEHLPLQAGRAMLGECGRVLRPGGRIRVSTPDLTVLAGLLVDRDDPAGRRYAGWAAQAFCPGAAGSAPALTLNNAFRAWGHRFLYDQATLTAALHDAGFVRVRSHPYRHSDDPVLDGAEGQGIDAVGLEMRAFETLALEADKP